MSADRVQGLAAAYAMFDRLPDAAREQLGVELAIIGRDILAQQRAAAPKGGTGYLEAGLSLALYLDNLRIRVGLLGLKRNRSKRNYTDRYYGRFVEFGRSAQTVLVQRRKRVLVGGSNRGILRSSRGRKRAEDIVATYRLKVKARDPRPFVQLPDAGAIAAQRLADFWSGTLNRAGA